MTEGTQTSAGTGNYALLVNPHSAGGRAASLVPEIERELGAHGLEHRIVETRSLEHGVSESLEAASRGEVPVVVSGDGLIGAVGGALAGSDAPMGIIPGGRGNDFARVLGIPKEVAAAVGVLAAGNVRDVDIGEVNGKRFVCIASCGFDSVANRYANRARLVRGNLVYAYAAIRALLTWKPANFTVTVDGTEHRLRGFAVAVANSKAYGGGMMIAPDADLEDGLFDIVLTAHGGKLKALTNLPKVFKGTHTEEEQVTVVRGSEVEVTSDHEFEVYADGEHLTDLPATMRVIPRALKVIAAPS